MAVGGSAYLVSKAIKAAKVVGFEDLGMEAIYEFDIVDMPVTVAVDAGGTSAHETGPAEWKRRSPPARSAASRSSRAETLGLGAAWIRHGSRHSPVRRPR